MSRLGPYFFTIQGFNLRQSKLIFVWSQKCQVVREIIGGENNLWGYLSIRRYMLLAKQLHLYFSFICVIAKLIWCSDNCIIHWKYASKNYFIFILKYYLIIIVSFKCRLIGTRIVDQDQDLWTRYVCDSKSVCADEIIHIQYT